MNLANVMQVRALAAALFLLAYSSSSPTLASPQEATLIAAGARPDEGAFVSITGRGLTMMGIQMTDRWNNWTSFGAMGYVAKVVPHRKCDGAYDLFAFGGPEKGIYVQGSAKGVPRSDGFPFYTLGFAGVRKIAVVTNADGGHVLFAIGQGNSVWFREQAVPNPTTGMTGLALVAGPATYPLSSMPKVGKRSM